MEIDVSENYYVGKPTPKTLNVLILGGGPTGLFIGYKLLKKGHNITIFEKRNKYTRHNIMSLQETSSMDTLSIIPSEIMEELNNKSSFSHIYTHINSKKHSRNFIKNKPYFMVSSRVYYIVLNELELAYERNFIEKGGLLIKPTKANSFTDITLDNGLINYKENNESHIIDTTKFDIIFINDGANSYYRDFYFKQTSNVDNIEPNIFKCGTTSNHNLKISSQPSEIQPLAFGMVLIYDIENKEDFQKKFNTEKKLEFKTDFNSYYTLESEEKKFLNGMVIKEVILDKSNKIPQSPQSAQNLFRMFVSENYLYISFMIDPTDAVTDYPKFENKNIKFKELPLCLQTYLTFALYYYDLSELIGLDSNSLTIKLFPLNFNLVKQSCTFVKKKCGKTNSEKLNNSYFDLRKLYAQNRATTTEISRLYKNNENCWYQLILLCGDAMVSGNFHAGIVLNKNLLAVNHICNIIDEYIDAYPKNKEGFLDSNFIRLLFFTCNLSNQQSIKEIINKSIDCLVNFEAVNQNKSIIDPEQILEELTEVIVCKNSTDTNSMCDNSYLFVQYITKNSTNPTLQKIIKYLLSPETYKFSYNEI